LKGVLTVPTDEEVTELAKRIWKENGGRDDLEWGAMDQATRTFYGTLAAKRLGNDRKRIV
jgi:hypothetical protein